MTLWIDCTFQGVDSTYEKRAVLFEFEWVNMSKIVFQQKQSQT